MRDSAEGKVREHAHASTGEQLKQLPPPPKAALQLASFVGMQHKSQTVPEAPRQGRPTLAVPAARIGDFGAPLQPVELRLGPLAAPAAGLEFVRAGSSEGALELQLWRQLRDRARLVLLSAP
jgi:hypothetical protein